MPGDACYDMAGVKARTPDRSVKSVCPYFAASGCQLTFHIENDEDPHMPRAGTARRTRTGCAFQRGPVRLRLCPPPAPPHRPAGIRRDDAPKSKDCVVDPANPWTHFREASWDEALDHAAAGLARIRDDHGPGALAGFGSAKGSNEEAYLFQKLVRTGFRTNNVDHCTRLCPRQLRRRADGGHRLRRPSPRRWPR